MAETADTQTLEEIKRDATDLAKIAGGAASAPDVATRLQGLLVPTVARVLAEMVAANPASAPVEFTAGLSVTDRFFTVTYQGFVYAAKSAAVPFTTTSTFDPSQWALIAAAALDLSLSELPGRPIPALISTIRTNGLTVPGDLGRGHYNWTADEPAHAGKEQSGDGSWWELEAEQGQVVPAQFGSDVASIVAAHRFAATQPGAGRLHFPAGEYDAAEDITLAGYAALSGEGNRSIINLSAGAALVYAHDAAYPVFDDHSHKTLRDLRVVGDGTVSGGYPAGDGTTKGYHHNSSVSSRPMVHASGMVFEHHDVGAHYDHTYIQSGRENYYRGNRIGLHIDSSNLTAEYSSYFRYNTEAAIEITSASQDALFVKCGIEGNPGRAIRVAADVPEFARYVWDGCYFELNGDFPTDVPAIENLATDPGVTLEFRGCNLWQNVGNGRVNGRYLLGPRAVIKNSRLEGTFKVDALSLIDGTYLRNASFNSNLTVDAAAYEPALLLDWDVSFIGPGAQGQGGYAFQISPTKGLPGSSPIANRAPTAFPHVSIGAGVTRVENASSDFGGIAASQITFMASAGSFNTNWAAFPDHVVADEYLRVDVFFLQCATDTTLGFVASGAAQNATCKYSFTAGKVYKMIVISGRVLSGTTRLRVFPVGTDAPVVTLRPCWSSSFADMAQASAFIGQVVRGAV